MISVSRSNSKPTVTTAAAMPVVGKSMCGDFSKGIHLEHAASELQIRSESNNARSQWEARGKKRELTRTPSAEEIQASTMPPEIPHDSSHPKAARTIAETFETLNVNAAFLKDAYPQMGERVARNVAETDFYTDFTGPDMAILGHMVPNNFTG